MPGPGSPTPQPIPRHLHPELLRTCSCCSQVTIPWGWGFSGGVKKGPLDDTGIGSTPLGQVETISSLSHHLPRAKDSREQPILLLRSAAGGRKNHRYPPSPSQGQAEIKRLESKGPQSAPFLLICIINKEINKGETPCSNGEIQIKYGATSAKRCTSRR